VRACPFCLGVGVAAHGGDLLNRSLILVDPPPSRIDFQLHQFPGLPLACFTDVLGWASSFDAFSFSLCMSVLLPSSGYLKKIHSAAREAPRFVFRAECWVRASDRVGFPTLNVGGTVLGLGFFDRDGLTGGLCLNLGS